MVISIDGLFGLLEKHLLELVTGMLFMGVYFFVINPMWISL